MCTSQTTQQILTNIPSFLMAVLTLAYVLLTWKILNENRNMLIAQDRPFLQAQPEYSETGGHVALRNIGKGPALATECTVELLAFDSSETAPPIALRISGLNLAALERKEVAHGILAKLDQDIHYGTVRITTACRDIYRNCHGPITEEYLWDRASGGFRISSEDD